MREYVSVSIFQFTRFENAPRFMRQYMQNLNIFIHIHAHRINMMAFKVSFVEFCVPKSYSTTLTPSHAFPPTFELTSIPALVFILTAVISSLNSCSLNMRLQLPLAFTWTAFLYDPASSLNVVIDLFLLSLLAVFSALLANFACLQQDDRHRKLDHVLWLCQPHYSGRAGLHFTRPAAK